MIFIGVLTWIGLSIIGVPMALTLGLIAGLLVFYPKFWPYTLGDSRTVACVD